MKTRREVLSGAPSVFHFFGLLVPCLLMTVSSFLTSPERTPFGDPSLRESIGLLFFAARYGTFMLLGGMVLMHLLLKYVKPIRRAAFAKSPQVAADLYAN